MRAAEATLKLATDVRRQYFRTVAANQQVATLQQAKVTTDAAAELARKLGETGGMNKLDQAREYALAAELDSQLARARLAAAARTRAPDAAPGPVGADDGLPASLHPAAAAERRSGPPRMSRRRPSRAASTSRPRGSTWRRWASPSA